MLFGEEPWEGADLALEPSVRGQAITRVRQLRDPAVLDDDVRTWLLYCIAGESGVALAELTDIWPLQSDARTNRCGNQGGGSTAPARRARPVCGWRSTSSPPTSHRSRPPEHHVGIDSTWASASSPMSLARRQVPDEHVQWMVG